MSWYAPPRISARATLDWRAPRACPDATEARAEIERLLRAELTTLDSTVHAMVEITELSGSSLEACVVMHLGTEQRELRLRDTNCLALTRAAALVVALAIDPTSGAKDAARARPRAARRPVAPAQSSPSPEGGQGAAEAVAAAGPSPARQEPAEVAAPPPTPPTADESSTQAVEPAKSETLRLPYELPTPAEPRPDPPEANDVGSGLSDVTIRHERDPQADPVAGRTTPFVGAGIGVMSGVIPKLAPMAMLSGGLAAGSFRTALRIGYAPAQSALIDGPAGIGVGCGISLAQAALEAGVRARAGRVEVPFLAGVESGFFAAHSVGAVLQRVRRTVGWLAGYLSSGLSVAWSERLSLGLRLEALLALRRPSFALQDETSAQRVLHRPELFNVRAYLALEVQF